MIIIIVVCLISSLLQLNHALHHVGNFPLALQVRGKKNWFVQLRSYGVVQPPTAKNSLHQSLQKKRTMEMHGVYDDVILYWQ